MREDGQAKRRRQVQVSKCPGKKCSLVRTLIHSLWPQTVSWISKEEAHFNTAPVYFQTALHTASRLSLTNLAAFIYSRRGPTEVCAGRHTNQWLVLPSLSDRTFVHKSQGGWQEQKGPLLPSKKATLSFFLVPCGQKKTQTPLNWPEQCCVSQQVHFSGLSCILGKWHSVGFTDSGPSGGKNRDLEILCHRMACFSQEWSVSTVVSFCSGVTCSPRLGFFWPHSGQACSIPQHAPAPVRAGGALHPQSQLSLQPFAVPFPLRKSYLFQMRWSERVFDKCKVLSTGEVIIPNSLADFQRVLSWLPAQPAPKPREMAWHHILWWC